ncbi:peptide chain release factor H [Pseudobacter ginsenosidimutans]|uniref:Peptide chain release factor n=1 Tax=Pseudobacter ginsenosidimutans TaxID=661488 RepID=A0A4Q7N5B4_9BACT|nr:peptide chain release factor H [Pseudobacter ginsenosidimutans]QEC44750.1 peptide chain release factor H [Pseudobacter ginsenosidimutans]RZS76235.1 peptide chain release factor [Pseudobacter ginsenosidimutans]
MDKIIIQISSGRGPVECCRVVTCIKEKMLAQSSKAGYGTELLEETAGPVNGTHYSVTLQLQGRDLESFIREWRGTIKWIAQSPYRKNHKRKNWFAGVAIFGVQELPQWNERDVKFETCRASGPGGQNVNKVESAVRGMHIPSGIQVLAMDSRSQLQNKKLCLERLRAKVMAWQMEQLVQEQQCRWQLHNILERGNEVKIITEIL